VGVCTDVLVHQVETISVHAEAGATACIFLEDKWAKKNLRQSSEDPCPE
jgi:hypothetical protein